MRSATLRHYIIGAALTALLVLGAYRLVVPVPGAVPVLLLTVLVTALIAADVLAVRRIDPHQINLTQEKTFAITLPSILATTAVTGVALVAVLAAAEAVLLQVVSYAGYESLSVAILGRAVDRITVLAGLDLLTQTALVAVLIGAMAAGFWTLYPLVPTEREPLAAPLAFLVTGVYLLAATTLLVGTGPLPHLATLALDAALVAVWGKLFARTHVRIHRLLHGEDL